MGDTTFDNSSFTPGEYRSPQASRVTSRSSKKILLFFLVLVLLAIGWFGITKFGGSKQEKQSVKTEITPTPTEYQFPTDTPAPSVSPASKETPTPTPKPTINPVDKTTGLDRSGLNVEVQNGSGVVGVASKMADFLKTFGYHIVATGNADNYNYENVTVSVKSASSKYLNLLKTDIAGQYTVGSASAELSASASADAVVIIGK